MNKTIKISVEMMSPFSNHFQFVQYIVLDNLALFIKSFENNKKEIESNSRLFFNAVISANHIPDYMFWDWEEDFEKIGIRSEPALYTHLEKIEEFSFMKDIRDVANAAKHCVRSDKSKMKVRRDKSKMKAKDISKNILNMNVDLIPDENIRDFQINSDNSTKSYYEENSAVIEKAWQFWEHYHPNKYKEKIFETAQIGGEEGGEKSSVETTIKSK